MRFGLRPALRASKFVPDEFVRHPGQNDGLATILYGIFCAFYQHLFKPTDTAQNTMRLTGYAREHASLLVFFTRLLDAGLIFASGIGCFYLLEPVKNFPAYDGWMPQNYLTALGVAILLSAWWFPAFNVYRSWRGSSLYAEMRPLALGWLASLVGLVAFIFFTKTADEFSRHWLGLWFLTAFAAMALMRLFLRLALLQARRRGYNLRHIALVGGAAKCEDIARRIESAPWLGLAVSGYFGEDGESYNSTGLKSPLTPLLQRGGQVSDNAVELAPSPHGGRLGWGRLNGSEASDLTRPHPNPPPWREGTLGLNSTTLRGGVGAKTPAVSPIKRLGDHGDLLAYLECHDIDQVWIALPLQQIVAIEALCLALEKFHAEVLLAPDISGWRLLNNSITQINGLPLINITASPMNDGNVLVKWLEDKLLSLLILMLASPLLLLIAVLIKLTSRGPALYGQERVSWNGKRFNMLKFRTMPVGADESSGEPVWGQARAKRPTRLGAFLRKTSLDELPQFFNVLKGDMSIVGPRPERPIFVEQFRHEIDRYMQKHLVKAGITGWAQVNGWRGDTCLQTRVEYDLHYIEHWSLWFDLKIILLTLFRGMVNRNAC